MAELSICQTTTFRWSFEEDVRQYSAAGLCAVGLWRHKLSDCGAARAADLLQRSGLRAAHLCWAGGFTGSDGRTYRDSIDDAAEALRTAAALACPTLIVYTGPYGGHTGNHARRLVRGALAELAPQAAELGVTLAIEPVHSGCAAQWTFLTSLDGALDLLQDVAHPRVKLVLDTYHLGLECGLADRIAPLVPQIALVQLGDARRPPAGEQDRCRLGDGRVPLPKIVAALRAGGYDGYYDVELLGEEVESADYRSLLEHAKEAYNVLVQRGER
jgi:sugar phosphate isomerase/epimerase